MSLISLGYIFTYYFLLISSYSLSHFFSRQALSILIHHSLCEKHSKLSLHFFWVRSVSYLDDRGGRCYPDNRHPATC
ncbi:hypothetical protein HUB92_05070 [Wolbachia endosymbiont of Wiebesia pumilae]|uniref:hypothetical protein n=1 Tax=Wolbachia endosymbiont of Wiebesia pumilae TaxID=2742717 RepID=UPI001AE12A8B|nr:hypothetical protein [Wolbachia endosymbiont of Wiebesia pumilae]QTP62207.1 hypothetical protein HUB92_05070 [Wolbachia endosymbiont of Wiebesia pumilae]